MPENAPETHKRQNQKTAKKEPLRVITGKGKTDLPRGARKSLLGRVVKVKSAGDAKKLLGRVIEAYQKQLIPSQTFKDLVYACQTFCAVHKEVDVEERLAQLEKETHTDE